MGRMRSRRGGCGRLGLTWLKVPLKSIWARLRRRSLRVLLPNPFVPLPSLLTFLFREKEMLIKTPRSGMGQ